MKRRKGAIVCCTDGMKPAVFRIERVDSCAAPELRDIPEDQPGRFRGGRADAVLVRGKASPRILDIVGERGGVWS